MRKLDDVVPRVLTLLLGIGAFATLMSLLQGIGSVNGWNAVMAVNVLVMVSILVGRLVVRTQSVKR